MKRYKEYVTMKDMRLAYSAVSLGWCKSVKFGEYEINKRLCDNVMILCVWDDWKEGPKEFVEWVKMMKCLEDS